ncbi:MAG: heme o synthase [Pseudomonadota bacterium]
MSQAGETSEAPPTYNVADVQDFVDLLKPRVMSLAVFTAFVGMTIAPGDLNPVLALASLLAIAVGAGAAGSLNMWYDADIDGRMARTAGRPIPQGKVPPAEALAFGMGLGALSVVTLALAANYLAAGLLAAAILFYLFVYTMWLKRRTPQNIVIGGAAGALPPAIGWAAATGEVGVEALVLFLIIFLWTPPHFWALALYKRGDYDRAGVPMLPVVKGEAATRRGILIYSVALAAAALAPLPLGFAGWVYGAAASAGGAAFVWLAWRVLRDAPSEAEASRSLYAVRATNRPARNLFAFSIAYLFVLYAALLADYGLARLVAGLGG